MMTFFSLTKNKFAWTAYKGPRGGQGWKNEQGNVVYGDKPDEKEEGHEAEAKADGGHKEKSFIRDTIGKAAKKFEDIKATSARFAQMGFDKLPAKVQQKLVKTYATAKLVEHQLTRGFAEAKKLAKEIAVQKGLDEVKADKLARMLGTADMVAAWTINAPAALAVTGSMTAAKVSSWLPVASLSYIAASSATNPMATLRAAKKLYTRGKTKMERKDGFAERLAEELSKATNPDWFMALFSVALDESGDEEDALRFAVENVNQPEQDGHQ